MEIVSVETGVGALTGDATGSVVDLFVGYNMPFSESFLGGFQIEGTAFSDITLKSIGIRDSESDTTQTVTPIPPGPPTIVTSSDTQSGTSESTDELRSMIAFVARGGVFASPDCLFYGLAGLTLGNFVVPDGDDPFGGDRSQWETGYTLGAGGEYRLNPAWSLRAEFRYISFDIDRSQATFNSQTTVQGTTTFSFENTFSRNQSTDFDFNLGKIGVVYQFGGP